MKSSVDALLEAYNLRPWRAEALYGLSQHFRQKGQHEVALLFADHGRRLAYPKDDILMIEDLPYRWGFAAEIATSGMFSKRPQMREEGHYYSEMLALSREFPAAARERVWRNLFYYTKRLQDYAPSFTKTQIQFDVPKGFYPMNPSVCRTPEGGVIAVVRCVNYKIGPGKKPKPTRTRNFLLKVDWDISRQFCIGEIEEPDNFPKLYGDVLGLEDMRLFFGGELLRFSATSRQHNVEGWCEIGTGLIDVVDFDLIRTCLWRPLAAPPVLPRRHEKNWLPIADGSGRFVYSFDPYYRVDCAGGWIKELPPPISAHHWKGSTQLIPFDDGYLCMVHERPADLDPGLGKPPYRQRFVWFDKDLKIRKVSWGFEFGHESAGEYVCGMCMHPDNERLVISYGVLDREAWLATVKADEIRDLLRDDHVRQTY